MTRTPTCRSPQLAQIPSLWWSLSSERDHLPAASAGSRQRFQPLVLPIQPTVSVRRSGTTPGHIGRPRPWSSLRDSPSAQVARLGRHLLPTPESSLPVQNTGPACSGVLLYEGTVVCARTHPFLVDATSFPQVSKKGPEVGAKHPPWVPNRERVDLRPPRPVRVHWLLREGGSQR